MTNIDWIDVLEEQNAANAYNIFSEKVVKLFNEHFPLVRLSRSRSKDKKWITPALRISSRHENKLYKTWLRTKDNKKLS